MPAWDFKPWWTGRDVVIIGGGASLIGFDFERLRGGTILGVNKALCLGSLLSALYFGDIGRNEYPGALAEWHERLEFLGAPVFVNGAALEADYPWLFSVPHKDFGLYTDAIGYNANSGAGAINLALLHGAKRLWLLGFDMKRRIDGMGEWYPGAVPNFSGWDHWLPRILPFFDFVARDWKIKFKDREIINVNDNSAIKCFPCVSLKEWKP